MRGLVTGGLGLVGSQYAAHALARGDEVVILDNESRGESTARNWHWLRSLPGAAAGLKLVKGDVADPEAVEMALRPRTDWVLHAAAQSSVNVSIKEPELDFVSNAMGTVVLLTRLLDFTPMPRVVFLASNKIYDTTTWPVERVGKKYRWVGRGIGPSEEYPFQMDAKEPYGASKIAATYYCRCYAAMYDMPVVVGVPSGMYGPRQFGRTEQGWMGWFIIATILGLPISIMGDGYQVRDMCHTDDVSMAVDRLLDAATEYKGELFNIGGGPRNAVSLLQALELIETISGQKPILSYETWRPQDNKVYVSNIERMVGLGWSPKVDIEDGITRMVRWVRENLPEIESVYLDREAKNAAR